MLVLLGELDGLVEGHARLGRLLRLQVLVATPATHRGDDQQRAGDDIDRILVPPPFELVATYVLVDFVKQFRHLKQSHPRWSAPNARCGSVHHIPACRRDTLPRCRASSMSNRDK